MTKISLFCVLSLFFLTCSRTDSPANNDLFEQYQGMVLETKMEKTHYDASEPIIVTGIALNNSKITAAPFTVVPLGANDDLHFVLRKLTMNHQTISFSGFDLTPAARGWKSTNQKLAPQERVEVFSFNLKDFTQTADTYFPNCPKPVIFTVNWGPGIYEFSWQVGFGNGLSKPIYFEIK